MSFTLQDLLLRFEPVVSSLCEQLNSCDLINLSSTSRSIRAKVYPRLKRRLCLAGKIKNTFDNYRELLKLLSSGYLALIGSRSLDMIWDSPFNKNDDWDFYCHDVKFNVLPQGVFGTEYMEPICEASLNGKDCTDVLSYRNNILCSMPLDNVCTSYFEFLDYIVTQKMEWKRIAFAHDLPSSGFATGENGSLFSYAKYQTNSGVSVNIVFGEISCEQYIAHYRSPNLLRMYSMLHGTLMFTTSYILNLKYMKDYNLDPDSAIGVSIIWHTTGDKHQGTETELKESYHRALENIREDLKNNRQKYREHKHRKEILHQQMIEEEKLADEASRNIEQLIRSASINYL
jgi:hypothetical protein